MDPIRVKVANTFFNVVSDHLENTFFHQTGPSFKCASPNTKNEYKCRYGLLNWNINYLILQLTNRRHTN